MWPKTVYAYLHADKEQMSELARAYGLKGEAYNRFRYALHELEVVILLNEDGSYTIQETSET
jgi:hypothetical protein